MKRRYWIVVGVITAFVATVVQYVDPVEVCCVKLPIFDEPRDIAEAERAQRDVIRHTGGSFIDDLVAVRLISRARKFGTFAYGPDDRIDIAWSPPEDVDARVYSNMAATALIVNNRAVAPGTRKKWRLDVPLLSEQEFCDCERFSEQYAAASWDPCTGFLLDDQHVATAGHCIDPDLPLKRRFIFGFRKQRDGEITLDFDENEVYWIKHVVYLSPPCAAGKPDIAIVALNRTVEITASKRSPDPENLRPKDPVYVIGYPLGLPAKYAANAVVSDNDPLAAHFVANIDGYDGNSGSPVFNANHDIVGVHVRGVLAIAKPCGCLTSTWCPDIGCRGERITRITKVPDPKTFYDTKGRLKPRPENTCKEPMPARELSIYEQWQNERDSLESQ